MCLLKIFVFVQFLHLCLSTQYYTEIGQLCNINNIVGVCKNIIDCQEIINMVRVDHLLPPVCFYEEEGGEIVCCPNKKLVRGPQAVRAIFGEDFMFKMKDATCYYDNREPFTCCKNLKEKIQSEPSFCPPLPKQKPKDSSGLVSQHPAWKKCAEYQQYLEICVARDATSNFFIRKNTCGIPKNNLRIFGGTAAAPKEFPHMVSLGVLNYNSESDIQWIGGGSLISETFVLTAAHVVQNPYGTVRYALLGSVDKTNVRDGILYNVINSFSHYDYGKEINSRAHDIALAELHQRVLFNEFIRPACLPVPGTEDSTDTMIVAGWGLTENQNDSKILLHGKVKENADLCKTRHGDMFNADIMICGEGESNSCKGDSGGPLMKLHQMPCSYTVEGVVSFGQFCGRDPGMFTRVSEYMDFIMKIVWPEDWEEYKHLKTQRSSIVFDRE